MKYNRSVYQSLAMIGQFGINILVPVLACSFFGGFLDEKLGTSCFFIILFFVGAVAGFWNIYRFSRRIFEKSSSQEAYLHGGRRSGRSKGTDQEEKRDEGGHHKNEQDIV